MLQRVRVGLLCSVLALMACGRGGDDHANAAPNQESNQQQQEQEQETPPPADQESQTPPPVTPPPTNPPTDRQQPVITTSQADLVPEGSGEVAADVVVDGYVESARFNVRFLLPPDWQIVSTPGEDSLGIIGPAGIQMVVANTFSVQLVDANFNSLNDRISFDNVNLVPDRTQARPINGLPAYRVEGDALLRGENTPIYFISQVINLPNSIAMATLFIPGENYFEYSDSMNAVLDSMEALDLRPQ